MPSTKSAMLRGKKQTAMPAPKSAAYKKIVAASKKAAGKKIVTTKAPKKRRTGLAFANIESRRRALERVKCNIWQSLEDINAGIIRLAVSGNYMAARALFDIAGVYALPPLDQEAAAQAMPEPASVEPGSAASCSAGEIDPFFRSLGVEPLRDDTAPAMAAVGL